MYLIIIDNCPHWRAGSVLQVSAEPFLKGSFSSYKDVIDQFCPSWIPKWLPDEWLRAKTRNKMETDMPSFSPAFS
jgi:hypothetical protein